MAAPRPPLPHAHVPRPTAFVLATLVLLAVALLGACGAPLEVEPEPDPEPKGSLRVVVTGLDAPAAVTVTGEDLERPVTETTVLTELPVGSYAVAAEPVVADGATHAPQVTGTPAQVVASATTEVAVVYTRNEPPTLEGPADATVLRNTRTPRSATFDFRVVDPDGDAVVVSAEASDADLLPEPLEPVCDSAGACRLTVTPSPSADGEATITVRADDGAGGAAEANATLTVTAARVTRGADDGSGSLRALVAAAEPGDVIGFAPGVRGTISLAGEIVLGTPLTIEGPGADALTLDGGGATRIFAVGAATVAIHDLTLANAFSPEDGGAVRSGGDLTLDGVTIRSSRTEGAGGGVHQLGAALRIVGGALTGNAARNGGGVAARDAELVLDGIRASGNVASTDDGSSAEGGAVRSEGGRLHVTGGSAIEGNAADRGGAVAVTAADARLDGGSVLRDNEATMGGGVYLYGSSFEMEDALVGGAPFENLRAGPAQEGVAPNRADAGAGIGGFYNDLVRLGPGAVVRGNSASGNGGGLMHVGTAQSAIELDGARVSDNHAGGDGGGLHVVGGATVRIAGGAVEANRGGEGGGVWVDGATLVLDGTQVVANEALRSGTSGGNGGGVVSGDELTVQGATRIADNRAAGNAGGVYLIGGSAAFGAETVVEGNRAEERGGGIYNTSSDLTLRDVEVVGNEVLGEDARGGGGLWTGSGSAATTIFGGTFRTNRTDGLGGAIYARGTLIVDGTTIGGSAEGEGNRASAGGGVSLAQSDVVATIVNGRIEGNHASSTGGGVYLVGPNGGAALTLETTVVRGNTADGNGGGLSAALAERLVLGPGVVIETNVAGSSGGGIYLNTLGAVEIAPGLVVRGNVATENGGGIDTFFGADLTLREAVIGGPDAADGNVAGGGGGGIVTGNSTVVLIDSQVENNRAGELGGGGLYGRRGEFPTSVCSIVLERTEVRANRSDGDGGGIAVPLCDLDLRGARIESNDAAGSGGGVAVGSGSVVVVQTAPGDAADVSTGVLANVAAGDGGGIHLDGGALTTVDTTIGGSDAADGNRAGGEGGGIWLGAEAEANLSTSVLRSNVAGGVGGGLAVRGASVAKLSGGDVRSNAATGGGGIAVAESDGSAVGLDDVDLVDNTPDDLAVD